MQQFIFVFSFLLLLFTISARGQAPAEAEKEQFSLHSVSKFCRYNNGKLFPNGGSALSISFTGIGGGWPGAASVAAPDSVPLANLFNSFDSVVALPDYRREWFYPEGELDATKKLRADMWRNNRGGTATAEYSKQSSGYQTARIEHVRTWVTVSKPVAYERNCLTRVSRILTVDNVNSPAQEHVVSAKIPANDTHSSGLDLKPGTLIRKTNGVSVETPFTGTYKEEIAVSFLPVQVVSRDKFLAGSIIIPSDWDSLELEFVGPDGSLGKYGNLLGGGTTRIYDRLEDILSEADYAAGIQSAEQKVWFVRNASDTRKIDFYTCFDSLGNTTIRLYLNGNPDSVGEITHLLKAAPDMAEWIDYTDQWIKGTSFDWGSGGSGPPVAARMGVAGRFAASSTTPQGLDNLTRAALIPVFIAIESVEGMTALTRGLLEGAKTGLEDDGKLIAAVGTGVAVSVDWLASTASTQINLMIGDPKWRATYFKDIVATAVDEYLLQPVKNAGGALAQTFSSWENMKNGAMQLWDDVYNTGVRLYIGGGQLAGTISDAIKAWHDKFSDKMLAGAESVSFKNTPWDGDIFFAGAANLTAMNYAAGYTVGYVCEQIAIGKGLALAGKVLVRAGASVVGKLATRTTFAVGTRMHKAKKAVQGGAASIEINWAIERGLARTGREPLVPLVRPILTSESLENTFKKLGTGRETINLKTLIDDLYDSPNIRKLTATLGLEDWFAKRLGLVSELLGSATTAEGLKAFKLLFERSLWFDPSGVFIKDHFDDLVQTYQPAASAQGSARLDAALRQYGTMAGELDDDLTTYLLLSVQDVNKVIPVGEHPAVKLFADRAKLLGVEDNSTVVKWPEGIAAVRYERKTGKILRRPTAVDIPGSIDGNELRFRVDYINSQDPLDKIDVKRPIATTPGFFETFPLMPATRLNLGNPAVNRIRDNMALVPPIPTKVVIDTFGLSGSEVEFCKDTIRSSGLDQNLFIFTNEL